MKFFLRSNEIEDTFLRCLMEEKYFSLFELDFKHNSTFLCRLCLLRNLVLDTQFLGPDLGKNERNLYA